MKSAKQEAGYLEKRLAEKMQQYMQMQRQQFQQAVQSLDLLSPLKIMGRGYTYTTIKERVVKSVTEVQPDDSLVIHYQDGQVIGKVQKVKGSINKMANPTFEESLQELEKIVMQLEQGDVPLESALDAFKRGMELSKQCQDTLTKAEETLTKMMTESNEEISFEGKEEA